MSKSSQDKLLELSDQIADLQRQMHEVLKNRHLVDVPLQAISGQEIEDKRLLALIEPVTVNEQISEMLTIFRESVGMKKVDMAVAMDVNEGLVRKMEKGKDRHNTANLTKFVSAGGGRLVVGIYPGEGPANI